MADGPARRRLCPAVIAATANRAAETLAALKPGAELAITGVISGP